MANPTVAPIRFGHLHGRQQVRIQQPHFFRLILLLLGTGIPSVAHAHGEEVLIFPLLVVLAAHFVPVADLLRRGALTYAAFYFFTQPVLWGVAAAVGFVIALVAHPVIGESAMPVALVCGFLVFSASPFFYWRLLLRWHARDAA